MAAQKAIAREMVWASIEKEQYQVNETRTALADPVPVLYIGGYSRSGSTLLMRMLSQVDRCFAVGELWDLWERSFNQNQLCGCGEPFLSCPFWSSVVEEAFGSHAMVNVAEMQAMRKAVQSPSALPRLAVPLLRSPDYREKLEAYSEVLTRLYRAIRAVSGCRIILDSSKVPTYAFLLQSMSTINLQVLHLVRDSRATAYSWQRKKRRPEIHWKTAYMDQYSPFRSATEWSVMNALLQTLSTRCDGYYRLRYEELVSGPRQALERVGQTLSGIDVQSLDFGPDGCSLRVSADHTVSGNPDRFQQGMVQIRPDTEWKTHMASSQKRLVTTLTWPLLLAYGYLGREADWAGSAMIEEGEGEAGNLTSRPGGGSSETKRVVG